MRRTLLPGLSALLALSFLFAADAHGRAIYVRVPDVVGMRTEAAARRLEEVGLRPRLLGRPHGEGIPVVHGQRPVAGTRVRAGAQIRVSYRWASFGVRRAPPSRRTSR